MIENLRSFVKMKLYDGSKQYNSKADLGKAIKTEFAEVKKITKLMDNSLLFVTEKKDNYIKMQILMILVLFIEVKCNYLLLSYSFWRQCFRIRQITSIRHIDSIKNFNSGFVLV